VKLLICGSEGRLMSATIPHLLEAGHEIVGVDTCEKWGVRSVRRDYRFVQADASDPAAMRPLLQGVEGVIQAAATLFGVMGFHRRCADILAHDMGVHQNILELSVAAGLSRVVYMSSSMVYEMCRTEPYDEDIVDDAVTPRTEYGLSKLVGERLSKAYWKQYNVPYTIWRPFNVIDPDEEGSDDPGVSHVFADLIHRLIVRQQNPLEVLGDGQQVRSFVHIREISEAIARFSFREQTRNQTYNLGRNEPVTVVQLAQAIYEKACARGLIQDARPLEFRSMPVPPTDVRRRVGCFEKAEKELNWKSKISLDRALEDCLDSFQARTAVGGPRPANGSARSETALR